MRQLKEALITKNNIKNIKNRRKGYYPYAKSDLKTGDIVRFKSNCFGIVFLKEDSDKGKKFINADLDIDFILLFRKSSGIRYYNTYLDLISVDENLKCFFSSECDITQVIPKAISKNDLSDKEKTLDIIIKIEKDYGEKI